MAQVKNIKRLSTDRSERCNSATVTATVAGILNDATTIVRLPPWKAFGAIPPRVLSCYPGRHSERCHIECKSVNVAGILSDATSGAQLSPRQAFSS